MTRKNLTYDETYDMDSKPYFKSSQKDPEGKKDTSAKNADNLKEYGQYLDTLIDNPEATTVTT
jgi:hypothetical protein